MRPLLDFIHEFVPGTSGRTLLLLHGTGCNEHDLIPLGRELDPNAALLRPRGKILENGMPRFFRRLAEGALDVEDLKQRTNRLRAAWPCVFRPERPHVRRTEIVTALGPAPRRSVLRKNRRLTRAKRRGLYSQVKIDNFFAELKPRNAYKAAIGYAVVGWLLRESTEKSLNAEILSTKSNEYGG